MDEERSRAVMDAILASMDGLDARFHALTDRLEAGDEGAQAEAHELATDFLATILSLFGTDRARALRERVVAGEDFDQEELRETVLEAFARVGTEG